MTKRTVFAAILTIAATSSAAFAGGPIVVDTEDEPAVVIADVPSSSLGGLGGTGAVAAGVLAIALIAAIASDNKSGSH